MNKIERLVKNINKLIDESFAKKDQLRIPTSTLKKYYNKKYQQMLKEV